MLRVRPLDRDFALAHMDELTALDDSVIRELGDAYSHQPWGSREFALERTAKWELSRAATEDGHLVGFAVASRDGEDAHIHRFAVSRDVRGGLAARMLIAACELAAREGGAMRVTLSVAAENGRALRFYERQGYAPLDPTALRRYAAARPAVAAAGPGTVTVDGCSYRILSRELV